MEMDDQELQKLVDWAIGKYFQEPPYVLKGGETITATDNDAIYEVLTLKAALNDETMMMDDLEIQKWVAEQVRDIYYDARSYYDAVYDLDGYGATDDFKRWATDQIPDIDFDQYPKGDAGDYRFNAWINNMYEDWEDHGKAEVAEMSDPPEL